MSEQKIRLELMDESNFAEARAVDRNDICEEFVDSADTMIEYTKYGLEHACIGHTYVIRCGEKCIGFLLLGEAIEWETDPEEMKKEPFYRLMGFVMDKTYRSRGIGGQALEMAVGAVYEEYGARPIALGVHRDNHAAARFYERHGFRKTQVMEGNDYYYLRYPEESSRKE